MKFYYNIEFRILIIKGKITVLFFNYSEDFRIVSKKNVKRQLSCSREDESNMLTTLDILFFLPRSAWLVE